MLPSMNSDDLSHDPHAESMDRKYGSTRHIYDLTRSVFLWGRNKAIRNLKVSAGKSVLEIGCGTGRNLKWMAHRIPDANLFGIDISQQMLATSRRKLRNIGNIHLGHADALNLDTSAVFGIEEFDAILMSFSLSMMPDWRRAVREATSVLKVGGTFSIIDFGDFENYGAMGRFAIELLGRYQAPPIVNLANEVEAAVYHPDRSFVVESWQELGGFNRFVVIRRIT